MKFRVHFTIADHADHIDLEGDTLAEILQEWDEWAEGKPVDNVWSEAIA